MSKWIATGLVAIVWLSVTLLFYLMQWPSLIAALILIPVGFWLGRQYWASPR